MKKMIIRKFLPPREIPPEKFPPIKLFASKTSSRKIGTQKILIWIITTESAISLITFLHLTRRFDNFPQTYRL